MLGRTLPFTVHRFASETEQAGTIMAITHGGIRPHDPFNLGLAARQAEPCTTCGRHGIVVHDGLPYCSDHGFALRYGVAPLNS